MKINRLNEELLRVPNMEREKEEVEPKEAMPPDFAGAIEDHNKIENKLEDDFKEQEKAKEEFIKETEKTETPKVTNPEMKKMKLSESLFEDVKVESPTVDDEEIVDTKTETPTQTLTEDVDDSKYAQYVGSFGAGPCAPISSISYLEKEIHTAIKHLEDDREKGLAQKTITRNLDILKSQLKDYIDFNEYWTKHYAYVKEAFDRVISNIETAIDGKMEESINESNKTTYRVYDDEDGNCVEVFYDSEEAIKFAKENGHFNVVECTGEYTEEIWSREANEDDLKEATAVLDRPVIANTIEDADEGDDLWTKVYDELDASLDPQDCNREVRAKRGERYQKVHTSNDGIVVYGTNESELEFAKKVADHYGCEYTVKEDKNSNTNEYYKYSLTIHMPLE